MAVFLCPKTGLTPKLTPYRFLMNKTMRSELAFLMASVSIVKDAEW
jgi:hypothetical protein